MITYLRLSSSTGGQCELIDPCALASSKKLIVFSCYLECGIKKLISQGAGFDVYFSPNQPSKAIY